MFLVHEVFLSGGNIHDGTFGFSNSDILTWNPEHSSWSKVGVMAVARYGHAVTNVDYNEISQYCVEPTTTTSP